MNSEMIDNVELAFKKPSYRRLASGSPPANEAARERLFSVPGDPLFVADWTHVLFLHFEVSPALLHPMVPFPLDLFHDRAMVTLVLFTMREMRFVNSGRILKLIFWPVRTQQFLNVRTYVRVGAERGIHFIAEWISHPLCVCLGKPLYGLPYHWGNHRVTPGLVDGIFSGRIQDRTTRLTFSAEAQIESGGRNLKPCPPDSLDEFLLERYAAFNGTERRKLFFRIWHAPWQQAPAKVHLAERSLIDHHFKWLSGVPLTGANYSPGAREVLMGAPHRL